mmetsp:Transcript_126341/g.338949  ORF Transcript_126341/g.338949 Transcript_126341/m.338949 type:complete len:210 (-) Transcript_126341:1143-1772(-)
MDRSPQSVRGGQPRLQHSLDQADLRREVQLCLRRAVQLRVRRGSGAGAGRVLPQLVRRPRHLHRDHHERHPDIWWRGGMGWGRLRPNLHDRVRVQVRRGAILQVRHLQRGLAPRDGGAGPEGHGARAPCGHDVEQPPREVFLHTHEPHRPSLDPAHVGGASDQAARGKQRGRGHEPDIPAGPAAVPAFPHLEVRQIQFHVDSPGRYHFQ